MISLRSRFAQIRYGKIDGAPLVDIGTTSLTGIRVGAALPFNRDRAVANPVFGTRALTPTDCIRLGSDFIRTGLLFSPPTVEGGQFIDGFGVKWLWDEKAFSPLQHPLETAGLKDIVRHPRPQWHQSVQFIEPEQAERNIVIADAPCPGLLDLCFMMRNTWQFMQDVTVNWRIASALLEWSLETIVDAYKHMLGSLVRQPDIVVYSDDLGFRDGMFFSPLDFRNYLRPWLSTLLDRLRRLTPAVICFHSCGAIAPILPDIVELGVEIINLETTAKGMAVTKVRETMPISVMLHGSTNLCALGDAVIRKDMANVARLITELAQSAPVIAGPVDNLCNVAEVNAAVRGSAFIHNLSDDDFNRLRHLGPVRSIIEEAMNKTQSDLFPAYESEARFFLGEEKNCFMTHLPQCVP